MHENELNKYDRLKLANVAPSFVNHGLRNDLKVSSETKKSYTIGVLVHALGSQLMASILSGIEQVLTNAGHNLVICHSADSTEKEIECSVHLLKRKIDGLIVSLAISTVEGAHFDEFFKRGLPVVFFDRVEKDGPGAKIVIDNFQAGYKAAIHLIQQGCKNFMHITGNLQRNVYADRWKGFQTALSKFGLHCTEDHLFILDFSEKSINKVAQKILQMKKLPDGIFITDDFCAAICVQHFKRAGIKVPEQIAVIGFNNDVISRVSEPQLTTFNYPSRDLGEYTARSLLDQLNTGNIRKDSFSIELKSEFIIRNSTNKKK